MSENKGKRKDRQILRPWQTTKQAMEYESDSDTYCSWCTWNSPQRLGKRNRSIGNQRTNRDHLDDSIVEIGQNTDKSPGGMRRLAVTQIPVNDHQLTLVLKTRKE